MLRLPGLAGSLPIREAGRGLECRLSLLVIEEENKC